MENKFKLGDILLADYYGTSCKVRVVVDGSDGLFVAGDIVDPTCLPYDIMVYTYGENEVIPYEGGCWTIDCFDNLRYYTIADTKIARKLYPNAEDFGNGKLRMRNV